MGPDIKFGFLEYLNKNVYGCDQNTPNQLSQSRRYALWCTRNEAWGRSCDTPSKVNLYCVIMVLHKIQLCDVLTTYLLITFPLSNKTLSLFIWGGYNNKRIVKHDAWYGTKPLSLARITDDACD